MSIAARPSRIPDGRVVVEAPHRRLAKLGFCTRGEPSEHATRRWREIEGNVA